MVSRRALLVFGTFAAAMLATGTRSAARAHETVRFSWRVPAAHEPTVAGSLRYQGTVTAERDTKGLPLVVIFVGVATLPYLADAILTLRAKLVQPGIRIDARGPEIKIEVDSTLPRGHILLVDAAGAKLYGPGEVATPAELLKALSAAKAG